MRDVMSMGLGERTVTVNRLDLLKALEDNLEKHRTEYAESVSGYKVLANERLDRLKSSALAQLDESFLRISAKIDKFDPDAEDQLATEVVLLSKMSFNLKVPEDHSHSYEVAIQMAKWEVNETIELTQGQFQCFVLDEWDWRDEFKMMNATYSQYSR